MLSHLDEDADGVVNVDHVMRVIKLLGTENVKISGKQISQIIDMLEKEDMLEMESNIETILVKSTPGDEANGLGEGEGDVVTLSRHDQTSGRYSRYIQKL